MLQAAYLLPLTAVALLVAVAALGFRAAGRRGYGPFLVGLVAAILLIVGKFVWESVPLVYGAIALLIAASAWNAWPKKAAESDLIRLGLTRTDS